MDFGIGTYGVGYFAGILSTLSPCVLPLVPILIGSAINAHRYGACALACGLAMSFTVIGLILATLGASLGIDQDAFRNSAAIILILFATVLLSTWLQQTFASATAAIGNVGNMILSKFDLDGLSGQFMIGLLLGIVWSPCVGPTLGAASTLASQGKNLGQIALLTSIFGIGAGTPLIILGSVSRSTIMRIRGKLFSAGRFGRRLLGVVMLTLGIAILTGADKSFETWVLSISPSWLTALTTRY